MPQPLNGNGTSGQTFPPTPLPLAPILPAVQSGLRTVLFGDSRTDYNFNVVNPTCTYDRATGVLTVVEPGAHLKPKGMVVNFWNRSYRDTYAMRPLPIASIINSTTYTLNLPFGASSDVPQGALAGTNFVVGYNARCSKSWLMWINALSSQRFNVVYNGAQSGDTTVDALARLQRDCLDLRPQVVVMELLGMNDLTFDTLTGRNNVQRIIANNTIIFDAITRSGAMLLLGLVAGAAAGEARAQLRIMAAKDYLNAWAFIYAQGNPNVQVLDCNSVVVDPTNTTGLCKVGMMSPVDFIHYSNAGAYRIAKTFVSNIIAAFPSGPSALPKNTIESAAATLLTAPTAVVSNGVMTVTSATAFCQRGQELFIKGATGAYATLNTRRVVAAATASNSFTIATPDLPNGVVTGALAIWVSRNLMPDPLMLTGGGTISNGIVGVPATDAANQLNVRNFAGTAMAGATASIVADSEGFGNAQRIRVATASLNDQPGVSFKNSVGTIEQRMYLGRTYRFEAKVVLTSSDWAQTPLSELGVRVDITANGGETWRVTDLNQFETTIPFIAENQTFHVCTGEITIPADTVSLDACQLNIWVRYQAAQVAGTLDIDFSRFRFVDITNDM